MLNRLKLMELAVLISIAISRPIKTELLAAIEDLMSRISGDELNKTKAFLEKLKK